MLELATRSVYGQSIDRGAMRTLQRTVTERGRPATFKKEPGHQPINGDRKSGPTFHSWMMQM